MDPEYLGSWMTRQQEQTETLLERVESLQKVFEAQRTVLDAVLPAVQTLQDAVLTLQRGALRTGHECGNLAGHVQAVSDQLLSLSKVVRKISENTPWPN